MITTISFDADNTLWDFDKVMRHSLECVRKELIRIPGLPAITTDEMIAVRDEVFESLKGKVANLEEVRLAAFEETLLRNGCSDTSLARKLNKIYLKHRFEGIELFDDVVPTLDRLKGKYKLGLLSNGNSYPEKCGLDGVFDFAVFAQDCGFEKPDSRIFEFALLKAGCASNEILHVGDSLRNDIEGARSASIASVWLNRDGENNSTNYIPIFKIETLSQLPEIGGRLNLSYRLCK